MNKVRRKLRDGIVVTPDKFGVGEVSWAKGVNFKDLNNLPESVKWWFSCLGFLRLLFTHTPIQVSDEVICKKIVLDFFENNPQSCPSFSRAWDGHAAALRASVLIDLHGISSNNDYLAPLLKSHLEYLLLEKNFQGHWNHGIDQSIALIKLGKCLDEKSAIDVGVSRLCESLSVLIDNEGASIEQAVHYQLYNYKQVSKSVDLIKTVCDDQNILSMLDDLVYKQKMMGEFLAHATRPDGSYFEIGDTPFERAEIIGHEEADYAASLGESGQAPKERFKVYKAGYIFGRSQWHNANGASAYAIRFGPPRAIHGHNDHSSFVYYTKGLEVLREGGFHGYTDDENRKYFRSLEAHNVVYVEDPKLKLMPCCSQLVSSRVRDKFQVYTVVSNPYDGVENKRTIIFSTKPEAIIVIDSLESEKEVRAAQKWSFGNKVSLELNGNEVTSKNGLLKLIQYYPYDELKVFNEDDDYNPSLVSTRTMYKFEKTGSVITYRSGRKITFLTAFLFSNNGIFPSAQHINVKNENIRRILKVWQGEKELRITFLENGDIDVF